jgi:branched-subunit amino acid transport protein
VTRHHLVLAGAALALAAGTFAFRLAGPLLRARITVPPWAQQTLETAAVVLLAALVATSALASGHHLAGAARPLGVLAGGTAAWRKAPFWLVILIAAGTTALLRLLVPAG